MTEEEIMKQLKKACILDPLCYEVDCLFEEDLQAIRGLVDLYQKQKEDIMYFRMDVQELQDDIEFWKDRCDNSVDKDDIKHKIMELEDKEKLLIMSPLEKQYKVQILKEILKEN